MSTETTTVEIDDYFAQFILERVHDSGPAATTALLLLGGMLATKECTDLAMEEALQAANLFSSLSAGDEHAISLLLDLELIETADADGMTDLGEAVISRYADKWVAQLSAVTCVGINIPAIARAALQEASGVQLDTAVWGPGDLNAVGCKEWHGQVHSWLADGGLIASPLGDNLWVATGLGLVVLWRISQQRAS